MKITNITYKETFNLGNYQSLTLEVTAALDETDDSELAMDVLQGEVRARGQAAKEQARIEAEAEAERKKQAARRPAPPVGKPGPEDQEF